MCKVLHGTFHLHKVQIITWISQLLYISPMHFISKKWKKVLMIILHPYSKKCWRGKIENVLTSTNWKKMKLRFFSYLYFWFHFREAEIFLVCLLKIGEEGGGGREGVWNFHIWWGYPKCWWSKPVYELCTPPLSLFIGKVRFLKNHWGGMKIFL